MVVVQGPKNSGKTTLIKSLVRHYTKQRLTDVHGPVTVRANRNLRLCFYECSNDMNSMLDLAKVADLALLVIDASIGFELETFEFLTIMQNHGLPCVMGVMTHLDQFKENKALRKIKKQMKKRFWDEAYNGAKLFHISGVKNDLYTDNEVHNLARFISVLKWKEVNWRANHSYILADRFEYKQELGRSVFYGYVRGAACNEKTFFVPGYGDYQLAECSEIDDPIPSIQEAQKKKTHRTLKQKEKALYAPSSNVGVLKYDDTTGYLNLPDRYIMFSKHDGENQEEFTEGQRMVRKLQEQDLDMEDLDNEIELLPESLVKAPAIVVGYKKKEDLKEVAEELKGKIQQLPEQEYVINNGVIMAALETVVYGKSGQPGRKIMSKNEDDTFKARYPTKYSDIEDYVKSIRNRFMAGTTIKQEEEKPAEDEEQEETVSLVKAGIKKGTYVKLEIEGLNEEIFSTINADKPVLLCGVKAIENVLGLLRGRVKNHKWAKKILKNQNPAIVSVGWQRFQTIPMYCTEDLNTERIRMIKYTPRFSFCGIIFFGPFVPVNTPFMLMSDINSQDFRISAIGTILELSHSYSINKKLKLIGQPYQVFKNTAYIKGMFNSQLEVSKFLGAKLKTVSGIRGMIKKAARQGIGPDGTFRATFEDKILMSDIVFLRTYYQVKPDKFYNPLINFAHQRLLKSIGELRKERGITPEDKKDSHYIPIVRKEKTFAAFRIPAKIEKNLPFKNKTKVEEKKEDIDPNLEILLTDREKKISAFLQRLENVKEMRTKKEKEKKDKRQEIIVKKQKVEEEKVKESLQRRIKNRMKKSKNRKKAFGDAD